METSDIEKIMAFGKMLSSDSGKKETTSDNNVTESRVNRQINTLNNIIPFLPYDIRRGVFAVVKILEMNDFDSKRGVIEAQNKYEFDSRGFADACRMHMNNEEKQLFNSLYILSNFKKLGLGGNR